MGISQLNCTERHFRIKIAKAQNEWKYLDDATVTGREMRLTKLMSGWYVFWQSSCFFTLLWKMRTSLFSVFSWSLGDHSASSVNCNYLPLGGKRLFCPNFGSLLDLDCGIPDAGAAFSLHNSTSLSMLPFTSQAYPPLHVFKERLRGWPYKLMSLVPLPDSCSAQGEGWWATSQNLSHLLRAAAVVNSCTADTPTRQQCPEVQLKARKDVNERGNPLNTLVLIVYRCNLTKWTKEYLPVLLLVVVVDYFFGEVFVVVFLK